MTIIIRCYTYCSTIGRDKLKLKQYFHDMKPHVHHINMIIYKVFQNISQKSNQKYTYQDQHDLALQMRLSLFFYFFLKFGFTP